MSEWLTYGSVRGATGNGGPYRDGVIVCCDKQALLELRTTGRPNLRRGERG